MIKLLILWRNQLIGAFGLGRPALHQFTEQDVEILALFAKHAAIAIVNARLFESERRRTARSTMINEISRQINSSLNLETSLQTAVESINQYLHYPNIALLLTDLEDPQTLVLHAQRCLHATRQEGLPAEYPGRHYWRRRPPSATNLDFC